MAKKRIPRRSAIKGIGAIGAATVAAGCVTTKPSARTIIAHRHAKVTDSAEQIRRRVAETPLVDSHEHLIEEGERLRGAPHGRVRCDDWALLMSHYLDSDLLSAGMPQKAHDRLFSHKTDPIEKWRLLEPYWPAVKNTGYGQAVAIAMRELYGVGELSTKTVARVQEQYVKLRKLGFYKKVLVDVAHIDSCQVNCLSRPFQESQLPDLLLQDISFLGMHMGPNIDAYAPATGIAVKELADWHKVIDWWFEKYGRYAVAVKSQAAYSRDLYYAEVKADQADPIFKRVVNKQEVTPNDRKRLEDHLFWYCVRRATAHDLPVKLHTGYYAGQNRMPLERVGKNPGSVCEMLRHALSEKLDTKFVIMHICYPYYEDIITVAKQYTNAYIDMCWAWIMNPAASVVFLKHYLLSAPANKLLTFGGDYIPVEPVVGHAEIARHGIARALTELVDEGWLSPDAALELVEPIMCGNGRRIFRLEEKKRAVRKAPWVS